MKAIITTTYPDGGMVASMLVGLTDEEVFFHFKQALARAEHSGLVESVTLTISHLNN